MVSRQNHRVTMWKDAPSLKRSGRGSYSSAACPNGVQYCDNATAWASCCYDIGGSYSITPQRAYQLLLQAGWYGDDVYSALYLIQRESSFVPDVIAHCSPCCCTEEGVNAVGLMQVTIEAHPEYSIDYLSDPLNNLRAAKAIQGVGGWAPWTPINAALTQATITYWQGIVGTAGNYGNEPGQSLAADIIAAPQAQAQDLPPAPQPQPDVPPPYIAPTVVLPQLYEFGDDFDGWDNVIRYYKRDLPTYVAFDDALNRILATMTGDVP